MTPGSAADRAGLRLATRCSRGDGKTIQAGSNGWSSSASGPARRSTLDIRRGGDTLAVPVTIGSVEENGKTVGRIGASRPQIPASAFEALRAEQRYGVLESLPRGVATTWQMTSLTRADAVPHGGRPGVAQEHVGTDRDRDGRGRSGSGRVPSLLRRARGAEHQPRHHQPRLRFRCSTGARCVYQVLEWIKGSPLSERALASANRSGSFF